MKEQPILIRDIEKIANVTLHPVLGNAYDRTLLVMPVHRDIPARYLLNEAGELIGLNLAGTKLTDQKWAKIIALPGFKPDLLKALNLRKNNFKLSPITPEMVALKHLDICDNKIKEIQPADSGGVEHILISGNKEMTSPPLEVVSQGRQAILNYFKAIQEKGATKIYEAKVLIVGSGGAGKTTLLRRLLHRDKAKMPTEAESTHGIEVHKMKPFDCKGEQPFQAHVWDFGGQEIYHATHQFFLTKRSLYILVSDARKEDSDFDYWLQIIQLLGEDSPVIIVQNEKGGRHRDINLPGIQMQFKHVKSMHSLDLSNPEDFGKLEALREDIQTELSNLPHIGDTLPNSWADVRRDLEVELRKNSTISVSQFMQICANRGEHDGEALRLSQYLHDLGFLLHFQEDPILKHTVILENSWATEGVYAVLDSQDVKISNKGRFSQKMAKAIWEAKESDSKSPKYKGKHDELLQLMLKFEICYGLPAPSQEYIAPQLLPAAEPESSQDWPDAKSLHLIFRYGFMPKGMMSRLIVRLNHYITDHNTDAWQSGAILHRGKNTHARMLETYAMKDIHVSAYGSQAKELLTIIAEEIDRLNRSYEKIKVEKLVPCICPDCMAGLKAKDWRNQEQKEDEEEQTRVTLFEYKVLERAIQKGVPTIQCQNSFTQVDVRRLIDSVFETTLFKSKSALKVFVSYSKRDVEHLDALNTHLSPLVRDEVIQPWHDRHLLPGEEWDKSIREQLASADIIILLVSADFMATEYVWMEIGVAIERHEKGEALVIPVIVRPCIWTEAPFAKFNALPAKGKPITTWENRDEAWNEVAEQVRRLSKKLL